MATRFALALVAALALMAGTEASLAISPSPPTGGLLAQVKAGADAASAQCLRLVQIEVIEFEECTQALQRDGRLSPGQRLGIDYFTFVGALSAQRSGALGAQPLAWDAVRRYKARQRRLGVDDDNLCRTVPGDCAARIARARALMNTPRPAQPTEDEVGRLHRH